MEDRQQRGIEASETGMEDDDIILQDEPLVQTPAHTPASSPKPSTLHRGLEQRAAELTLPASNVSTPTHLSSKARASTVPPPPKTPLSSVGSNDFRPRSLPSKGNTRVPPCHPEQNRSQDHGPAPRGPKNSKSDITHQKTKQGPSKCRRKAADRYFIGEKRSTNHRSTKPVQPWTPSAQTSQVGGMSGGLHNMAIPIGPRHLKSGAQAHRTRDDFVFPTVYER
jgi:hypothetical protein